jgi:hypothetical protein
MEDVRMRMKRRGIATIVEAIFSSLLLIATFSVGFYLLSSPAISHQRYSEDLTKVGYNLLSTLSANNGFDELMYDSQGNLKVGWEQQLRVVIDSLIAPNIIFNMTVYEAVNNSQGNVDLKPLNSLIVSNAVDQFGNSNANAFLKAGENAEASYIYTTKQMHILVISIQLATLGGV